MSNTRPGGIAVVTGASSGLGESFAETLAEDGFDLLLVARRADRLNGLAERLEREHPVTAWPMPLDLADVSAAASIAERLAELDRPAAVLVNNAGYGLDGRFLDCSWPAQSTMLQVMLHTPTELVHRLLPGMLNVGNGRVITMASLGGLFHSTPRETLYGPIKRFGIAFSRTLAAEYRGSGVTFTAVCPGLTRTEMMNHGRPAAAQSRVPARLIGAPRDVAAAAWKAALRGDQVFVPGLVNKLAAVGLQVLPAAVADRALTALVDRVTAVD